MLLHESRREARADERRRAHPARRAGPHALEPRAHRGGIGDWCARRSPRTRAGSVRHPGGHCRGARRGADDPRTPTGARSSGLYDLLLALAPSPIVALNRAVALAMRDGPEAGLAELDALLAEAANSTATNSRMRHAPTSAGASAATPRLAQAYAARHQAHRPGPGAALPRERRLAALPMRGKFNYLDRQKSLRSACRISPTPFDQS